LLPNTGTQDAIWLAERVRVAIEAASHTVEAHTIRMTVSAGVASLNGGTTALDVFLSMADLALFRAKAAGRNRVELSTSVLDRAPRTRRDRPSLGDRSAA
jgi:diguanylate cyclase (GGDEF)-like protein